MAVLGTFAQASRTNSGVRTELHDYAVDGAEPVELVQVAGAEHGLLGATRGRFCVTTSTISTPPSGQIDDALQAE